MASQRWICRHLLFLGLSALPVIAQIPSTSFPAATTSIASGTTALASATTSLDLSVDDLWNLFVGPVSTAAINTTVSATPVPSSELIPPPPLHYPSFPTGEQNPVYVQNASWSFPKDFFWGFASAAYQVEGAAKDEGRGPSIWDVFTHRVTNFIEGNVTGDVGDNHYYLYKQDIARMAALGTQVYSFSISWSRVMPYGRGLINEQALAHYDDMIETCLQYNITPIVTLYHWDTPLYLQNLYGGWLSEDIVADFVEYAQVVFERYGNRVGYWVTVNEPIVFCNQYPFPEDYFKTTSIPPKQQPFYCGQNVLLAHSQSYHLGKSMNLTGPIFFKNNGGYKIPLTNSSADALAVQRAWDFNEGWFADPIFLTGDYGTYLKQYTSTFLRNFTDDEKAMIKGSSDIFAIDAYTSNFQMAPDDGVDACLANTTGTLYPSCTNSSYTYAAADGGWLIGYAADVGSPWLHYATDWVPQYMHYINDTWNPQSIVISEFGFSVPYEGLQTLLPDILTDEPRRVYFRKYLESVLLALSEGLPIDGVLAWSFIDNLEWAQGYSTKFGCQYVNFSSPTLDRHYKASFFEISRIFDEYQQK